MGDDLPFIDEHRLMVGAPADRVWQAIAGRFEPRRSRAAGVLTRVLGAEPRRAHRVVMRVMLREIRRRAELESEAAR